MNEKAEEWNFFLETKFYMKEGCLFSDLIKLPDQNEFDKKKKTMSRIELEQFFNHFHLIFITKDINKQREYAIKLWYKWREQLDKKFPDKVINIEICDDGQEVIIYVYQNQTA